MKIIKTFNSNVVLVYNNDNREEIVMGKGIGFAKKPGDEISSSQIEKHFVFQERKNFADLENLFERIDYQDIEMASDIIRLFEKRLDKKVNESSLLALADHIGFAMKRAREGMTFRTPLEWELKQIYKTYYEVALEAVELLREKTGLDIPEQEASFITLHMVNGLDADSNGMEETMLLSKIMQNILNIINYHYGKEFKEDTIYFRRFVTHMRYFIKRQLEEETPNTEATNLLAIIKLQYKTDYECTIKIKNFLEKTYNWKITDNEILYLTLHINRFTS